MRTLSQILIQADNNKDDLNVLTKIWNEIKFSTFERELCETHFAREHLHVLIVEAAKKSPGILLINYCGEQ